MHPTEAGKGHSPQFHELFRTAHAQEQFRRYWLLSISLLMHPGEAGKRSFLSASSALWDCPCARAISPLLIAFYLLTDASLRSRKKVIPLSFMSSIGLRMHKSNFPLLIAFDLLTDASWRSRKKVIPLSFMSSIGLRIHKSNFAATDCFLSPD